MISGATIFVIRVNAIMLVGYSSLPKLRYNSVSRLQEKEAAVSLLPVDSLLPARVILRGFQDFACNKWPD
jgi:hypothetical protein